MRRQLGIIVCLVAALCACQGGSNNKANNDSPNNTAPNNTAGETVSAEIGPDGGDISLPGGATLEIPAGALDEATTITVSTPDGQSPTSRLLVWKFEPSGLVFDQPVVLRVPLEDVPEDGPIKALQWSELIDEQGEGELHRFGPIDELPESTRENVALAIEHFSFVTMFVAIDKYGYLTVDIPARFLLPGDLLFTLTSGGDGVDWQPGHVGVFTGGRPECNAPVSDSLIEATDPDVREHHLDDKMDGRVTNEGIRNEFSHHYLGARRPGELSDSERTAIVSFLRQQIGKPYATVFGQGNVGDGWFNCVGLAEAALDSIDRGVLDPVNEALLSLPLEMFQLTQPVTTIDVYAGELIEIPVYGTVVHPRSPSWFTRQRGSYCKLGDCRDGSTTNTYTLDIMGKPNEATWMQAEGPGPTYVFRWQTTEEDADRSEVVTFRMNADGLTVREDSDSEMPREALPAFATDESILINIHPCDSPPPECGNDIREGDEACDGQVPSDTSCESLGMGEGELGCSSTCEIDTSQCLGADEENFIGNWTLMIDSDPNDGVCVGEVVGRYYFFPNGQWGAANNSRLPSDAPGVYGFRAEGPYTLQGNALSFEACESNFGEFITFDGTFDAATGELRGMYEHQLWNSSGGMTGLLIVQELTEVCGAFGSPLFPLPDSACLITECDPARRKLFECRTVNEGGFFEPYPLDLCLEGKSYICWDANGNPL